jgi:hypothetical protein
MYACMHWIEREGWGRKGMRLALAVLCISAQCGKGREDACMHEGREREDALHGCVWIGREG